MTRRRPGKAERLLARARAAIAAADETLAKPAEAACETLVEPVDVPPPRALSIRETVEGVFASAVFERAGNNGPRLVSYWMPLDFDDEKIDLLEQALIDRANREFLLERHNSLVPDAAKARKASADRKRATDAAAASNEGSVKSPIKRLVLDTIEDEGLRAKAKAVTDETGEPENAALWSLLVEALPADSLHGDLDIVGWPDDAAGATKRELRRGRSLRYKVAGVEKTASLDTLWDYVTEKGVD